MARHGENIYKRRDGRYEGRYVIGRTEKGRTRFGYVYGRQYTDVQRRLMLKKAECFSRGHPDGARELTLSEWVHRWLESEVACMVKESTLQMYCGLARNHLLPFLGGWFLSQVTPMMIRELIVNLQEKGLGAVSIRSVLRLLSSAMRAAQDEGLIRKNPCRKVKPPSVWQKEQRVLTSEEQELLCAELRQPEDLPALLGLYTGMRLGEICALQWSDINWEQQTLTVRQTVQRVPQPRKTSDTSGCKTCLKVGTPKTAHSHRIIPLPEILIERLRTLKRGNRIFLFSDTQRAAEPRTIQRRFQRLTKRLGLGGVHFHTLRHTFATRLLELGVQVKTVSAMLGHASVKTTLDVYAHSIIKQQRIAVNLLAGC